MTHGALLSAGLSCLWTKQQRAHGVGVGGDDVIVGGVEAGEPTAFGAEHEHGGASAGQQVVEVGRSHRGQHASVDQLGEPLCGHGIQRRDVTVHQVVHARAVGLAFAGDDAVQLGVAGRELDEFAHHEPGHGDVVGAAQPIDSVAERRSQRAEQAVDRRTPQFVLGAEVVVEQRLGDPGACGDGAGRGSVKGSVGELVNGSGQDPLPGDVGRPAAKVRLRGLRCGHALCLSSDKE